MKFLNYYKLFEIVATKINDILYTFFTGYK